MKRRSLLASDQRTPATEFCVWHAGINETSKGPVNFTKKSAQLVMAEYVKVGRKLAIDFEHGSNPQANTKLDLNKPPPMAGYFSLALRGPASAPELWAVDVEWSDCGREHAEPGKVCCGLHQITTKQRRYFSPDLFMNEETSEPVVVNKLALCAEPATYGLQLLSKATTLKGNNVDELSFSKAILAACAAATGMTNTDFLSLKTELESQVPALASQNGLDLSTPEAAPVSVEAPAPVQAADPMPAAPKEEPKVTADEPKPPVVMASKALTLADMQRVVKEDREKQAILSAHAELLGPMVALLADKPIAEVRQFVVAAKSRVLSADGSGKAPSGSVTNSHAKTEHSIADRYKSAKPSK